MAAANWYPDPADETRLRWWDGERWSEHTQARPAPAAAGASTDIAHESLQPTLVTQQQDAPVPAQSQEYAPPPRGRTPYPMASQVLSAPIPSHERVGSPVTLVRGRPAVPAFAIMAGWAPDTCTRHHRPAYRQRKITFLSTLPLWSYLFIMVGILIFVIVALVVRKKVTSAAWPLCEDCVATRRRSMGMVAIGLGGIVPLVWLGVIIDGGHGSGFAAALIAFALIGLPILAAAGGILGSWPRIIGGVVSRDGAYVVFPPDRLELPTAARATTVGYGTHSRGAEILPA
jgi:hypothetical protein